MNIRVNFKESCQTFRVSADDLGVVIGNKDTGKSGTTFYPIVSDDGVISWTNDGGLPNPDPIHIKGPPGRDGISPIVLVEEIEKGHRVVITDKNGSQSFDILNGAADSEAIIELIAATAYSRSEIDTQLKEKAEASALQNLTNYIGTIPESYSEKNIIDYLDKRIEEIGKIQGVTGAILPPATSDSIGGVKSAMDIIIDTAEGQVAISKENAVYVDEQGEMSVKKITTDILSNGESELILSGGSAKLK